MGYSLHAVYTDCFSVDLSDDERENAKMMEEVRELVSDRLGIHLSVGTPEMKNNQPFGLWLFTTNGDQLDAVTAVIRKKWKKAVIYRHGHQPLIAGDI